MGFYHLMLTHGTQHNQNSSRSLTNIFTFVIRRTLKKHGSSSKASNTRLAEVGLMETPKADGNYETGQLFLHRVFGYRGVVLFPWTARIYDRDLVNAHYKSRLNRASRAVAIKSTTKKERPSGGSSSTDKSTTNKDDASSNSQQQSSSSPFNPLSPREATDANTPPNPENTQISSADILKAQINEVVNSLDKLVKSTAEAALASAAASSNITEDAETKAKASDTEESESSSNSEKSSNKSSTADKSSSSSTTTSSSSSDNENASSTSTNNAKELHGQTHTFYQVLIDARDCPFIRAQTEAVTFLGSQESNRSLYAVPGLDYVAHDDIMPYSSTDKSPLNHDLFDKFLEHAPDKQPPFTGKDTLKSWQNKNHPWLELSDVHRETTENIRITVIPFYMGCRETPSSTVFWWRYSIRLENMGLMSVQLRERHWRIFSLSGTLETVRGRGVVGQEPILSPRLPAFQYSSHVSLQAPSGHMWGTFRLEREDGHMFDCKIPPFSLESKSDEEPSTPVEPKKTDS